MSRVASLSTRLLGSVAAMLAICTIDILWMLMSMETNEFLHLMSLYASFGISLRLVRGFAYTAYILCGKKLLVQQAGGRGARASRPFVYPLSEFLEQLLGVALFVGEVM